MKNIMQTISVTQHATKVHLRVPVETFGTNKRHLVLAEFKARFPHPHPEHDQEHDFLLFLKQEAGLKAAKGKGTLSIKCPTMMDTCPCLPLRIRVEFGQEVCSRENDFSEHAGFMLKQKVKGTWNEKEQKEDTETIEDWDFKSMASNGFVDLHISVERLQKPLQLVACGDSIRCQGMNADRQTEIAAKFEETGAQVVDRVAEGLSKAGESIARWTLILPDCQLLQGELLAVPVRELFGLGQAVSAPTAAAAAAAGPAGDSPAAALRCSSNGSSSSSSSMNGHPGKD